jgi:hypothetical protein
MLLSKELFGEIIMFYAGSLNPPILGNFEEEFFYSSPPSWGI